MLKYINKLLNKNKKKSPSFFEMSAREKTKIMRIAVQNANKMQLALISDYEKKYGTN